jgi:hypothetical protein
MPPIITGTSGKEILEDVGINGGRVVRAEAVLAAGRVGILAAAFARRGVAVDHRVHAAGGDPEKQRGRAEFLEIAQVVAPVRLGDDGDRRPSASNIRPITAVPKAGWST